MLGVIVYSSSTLVTHDLLPCHYETHPLVIARHKVPKQSLVAQELVFRQEKEVKQFHKIATPSARNDIKNYRGATHLSELTHSLYSRLFSNSSKIPV